MATETVQGLTLRVTVQGSVSKDDGSGMRIPVDFTYEVTFADGTGSNQIGTVYQALASALNVTTETLDLDNLTIFGVADTGVNSVKFILAHLRDTTAGALLKVGGGDFAASTGPVADASDKIVTGPNGLILLVNPIDGWPITASTKDGLAIETTTNTTIDKILGLDNT